MKIIRIMVGGKSRSALDDIQELNPEELGSEIDALIETGVDRNLRLAATYIFLLDGMEQLLRRQEENLAMGLLELQGDTMNAFLDVDLCKECRATINGRFRNVLENWAEKSPEVHDAFMQAVKQRDVSSDGRAPDS